MLLVRSVGRLLVCKNHPVQGIQFHFGAKHQSGLPSNMEELDAQDRVGFSANRHKDISFGVVQSQTSSMFGGSFMSDQSSQGAQQLENYECLGSISLNAVTQTNVPQPFYPSIEKENSPRINLPENCINQQIKFTSSDLQETLHPGSNQSVQEGIMKIRGNCWYLQHGLHNAWIPNQSSVRYYSDAKAPESTKTKLKRAVKDYGATVIVFHVLISVTSLSICYAAVASGLDVPGMISRMGVSSEMLNTRLASGASTFLVAYAVHKLLVPIRISVTLGCVPFIVRYLRRIGFLKNPSA
ncbi:hypothetical protein OUZ56_020613 [Daphnia magna]|uniref:DUF1279 domain-containing protein n=1 Tax=Daphnia magna TaxID=35525 RepID=A0ABQ9ZEX6_9CRUS|nr:hypothetical protein OUZ56_020613 [Daphnia magna]